MGAGVAWSEVAALTFTGGLGAVASRDCVEAPPCWRAPAVATKRSATATAESASVRAWFPCMIPPTSSLRDRILRSEEHTSELQSHHDLVCRLLLEKKKVVTTEQYARENNLEI